MKQFKVLILTDHSNHSKENSLYALVHTLRRHSRCLEVDIATRGEELNTFFFKHLILKGVFVSKIDDDFQFHTDGRSYKKNLKRAFIKNYDVVWLRMPPPLSIDFLNHLKQSYPNQLFINDPKGIYKTGSKAFLYNFSDLCAPMRICQSVEDILEFKKQFPIVLKPFREYGGKGIVKIDGDQVWEGNNKKSWNDFLLEIQDGPIEYLAVKFLKNVNKGDKRIIVVNGKIIGSSLRLPPPDSWLCNVAMGGKSIAAQADRDEMKIVERIKPILSELGIAMYGIDTLLNDKGKRVLSEINTTSIGGIPQMEQQQGKPLVKLTTDEIWDFIIKKTTKKNAVSS